MSEPFDPSSFSAALRDVSWVTTVHAEAVVESTNDRALALADQGAPEGTVVVADTQTAGRGRLGRSWWSQAGGSLIASWIVRPSTDARDWPMLTLLTGVAVAEALHETAGLKTNLKWPNDVMIGESKLAGILAEARPPSVVVIGVGVNVSCEVPADAAELATNVREAGGSVPRRADLLAAVLRVFGSHMASPAGVLPRYRELCSTIGKHVRVERMGSSLFNGVAAGVDDDGCLLVDTRERRVKISSGDVVHVRTK